jgi:hypothetical protein
MNTLPQILGQICLRKECKERYPLSATLERNLRFQAFLRALLLVCAGGLIGSGVSIRLHGQSVAHVTHLEDPNVIAISTRVTIMDTTLQALLIKVDRLQSEADTTEAMGAGIGIAITLLQLLGFIAKFKQGG